MCQNYIFLRGESNLERSTAKALSLDLNSEFLRFETLDLDLNTGESIQLIIYFRTFRLQSAIFNLLIQVLICIPDKISERGFKMLVSWID